MNLVWKTPIHMYVRIIANKAMSRTYRNANFRSRNSDFITFLTTPLVSLWRQAHFCSWAKPLLRSALSFFEP